MHSIIQEPFIDGNWTLDSQYPYFVQYLKLKCFFPVKESANTLQVKISIVANGFQEDYTINLINALAKQAATVDFIGSNIYDQSLIDKRITFYNVRKEDHKERNPLKKGYWVLRYFLWYVLYLIRERKNIIHIQWLRFNFFDGIFLPLLARLLGHTVVYTAHDVLPHNVDNRRVRLLFKWIYKSQNALVVHTNFNRERILDEFGISQQKVSVVKHGVYDIPDEQRMDSLTSKKTLGIGADEFVLLFFGIITEYKGLDLLAESLKMLKKGRGKKIRLIIAGRVQTGFEDQMTKLKEEFMEDEVLYFLRFIENEEVNMLFGAADATVLPYREASQSGVMFMSFAQGVPVIAPNLGGFPDDVVEGEMGFIFECNNPDSLNEAIVKTISHFGPNNISVRENIINLTSEKYQWEESASALIKIYKK